MVCWASPNVDSELHSRRRDEAMENIRALKSDADWMNSLEQLEKSLKTSSGSLHCVDGTIYKIPSIEIAAAVEEAKASGHPPAAKKRKGAKGAETASASAADSPPEVLVQLQSYPPSESELNTLKKATQVASAGKKSAAASSSKRAEEADFIDASRITIVNQVEWIEKGLKTPTAKIAKTLVPDSVDPKSLELVLVRLRVIGSEGVPWRQEAPTKNQVGTLLVALPFEVGI